MRTYSMIKAEMFCISFDSHGHVATTNLRTLVTNINETFIVIIVVPQYSQTLHVFKVYKPAKFKHLNRSTSKFLASF